MLATALLAVWLPILCQEPPAGPPPAEPLLTGTVVDAAGAPRGGGAVVAVERTGVDYRREPPDGPAPDPPVLRAAVGADGRFSLGPLPERADGGTNLLVATPAGQDAGGGVGWAMVWAFSHRPWPEVTVPVRPAGRLVLEVRDGANRPLAGVRAAWATWEAPGPDGKQRHYRCTAALAAARGEAWGPSDADGRLELPGLWAGTSVSVRLVHPDGPAVTVQAEIPGPTRDLLPDLLPELAWVLVPAWEPLLTTVPDMVRGTLLARPVPARLIAGTVRVTVRPPEIGPELPTDGYRLSGTVNENDGKKSAVRNLSPATATRGPDGTVVLEWRVLAGPADVWIRHPTVVLSRESLRKDLTVAPDRPAETTIDAVPVVTVVGRLVDAATGEPLAGWGPWKPGAPSGYPEGGPAVKAFRRYRDPDWLNGYRAGRGWVGVNSPSPRAGVDHTASDADGRFTLRIPAASLRDGTVRVIGFDLPGGRLPAVADLAGAAAGETLDVGDLPLARVPEEIVGTVVDAAGAPVAGAAVVDGGAGLTASHMLLGEAVTDAAGRFRLAPRVGHGRPTVNAEGGVTVDLLAFDTAVNREGAAAVVLRPGEAPPPVRIVLADAPPPAFPEDPSSWGNRGIARGELSSNLRGGAPAPPWMAAAAFGPDGTPLADPPTLKEYRGRWVLLQLRPWPPPDDDGTGGRKVAAAYGDRVTVVTVFERAADPAAVRARLAADPAPGPVLVDAAGDALGGTTFAAYATIGSDPWSVRFLIDPAGRTVSGPGLRHRSVSNRHLLRDLRPYLAPR